MKIIFAVLYIISMVVSYFPRLLAVTDVVGGALTEASKITNPSEMNADQIAAAAVANVNHATATVNHMTILLVICYIVMIVVSVLLGKKIKHNWLFILPLVAGIFDIFIPFIPLLPTIFMLAGLLCGIILKKQEKAENVKVVE